MNNDEAKFILQAYRSGGQDAEEVRFAQALQQAQADPELLQWFHGNRALDAAVGAKLRSVPIPADLKASLLAGRKVVPVPAAGWRQPRWWAAAAVLALLSLLGGLLTYRNLSKPSFAKLQQDLPQVMLSFDKLEKQSPQLDEVRGWLAGHAGHADLEIPHGLDGVPSIGCRMIEWQGRKVTLVCFRVNPPAGQVAHLLVLNARDVRQRPGAEAVFTQKDKWSTAAWTRGDHVYLLATDTGGSTAQEILKRAG